MFTPTFSTLDDNLFYPDYEKSIISIPQFVKYLFFLEKNSDLPHEMQHLANTIIDTVDSVENVIIWLIDGIGSNLNEHSPYSTLIQEYGGFLSSVFPTTTAVAITSIMTGAPPVQHGLFAHVMHVPFLHSLIDHLRYTKINMAGERTPLPTDEETRAQILWKMPFFENFHKNVSYYHLIHQAFLNSGFSHIIYPQKERNLGYLTFYEALEKIRLLIERQPATKKLFILYTATIDNLAHTLGTSHYLQPLLLTHYVTAWKQMLNHFSSDTLKKTVIILVSDHGQVPLDKKNVFMIPKPLLSQCMKYSPLIGSSGRVLHFYPESHHIDSLKELLTENFSNKAIVLKFDEVLPLLGAPMPLSNEIRKNVEKRVGTICVVFKDNFVLPSIYSSSRVRTDLDDVVLFANTHGSLTPMELLTPFFALPLHEFQERLAETKFF